MKDTGTDLAYVDETFRRSFLAHWCDHYGLNQATALYMAEKGLDSGRALETFNIRDVQSFKLPLNQACLLRGAIMQYRSERTRVDKEIAKTRGRYGEMEKRAAPRKAWNESYDPKVTAKALDKLRGVVHRLSQLESDRNLGDSTQAAVIRELRRRLHKKKATVDDGMSLAQRILLRRQQAQAFQQQETGRGGSAPPQDRCRSARSMSSVQSSPACPQSNPAQQEGTPEADAAQSRPKVRADGADLAVAEDNRHRHGRKSKSKEERGSKIGEKKKRDTKKDSELKKRDSRQKMDAALQKLDDMFDEEELALIAAINAESEAATPETPKKEEVLKDEQLDRLVTGDFNEELDQILQEQNS